jgi:hypothetical protein
VECGIEDEGRGGLCSVWYRCTSKKFVRTDFFVKNVPTKEVSYDAQVWYITFTFRTCKHKNRYVNSVRFVTFNATDHAISYSNRKTFNIIDHGSENRGLFSLSFQSIIECVKCLTCSQYVPRIKTMDCLREY